MTAPSVHVVEVPLRWADMDAQRHVNNALVVDYLQEARVDFLLRGPNAHLLGNGILVVGHEVEFLRSIEPSDEPLRVELRVGEVGASRLTMTYELHQAGHVVARASTLLCTFDLAAGRPRRMTPGERDWFSSASEPSEPFRDLGRWRPGPCAHRHPIRVRWSDIDAYRHVNNAKFFEYTGEARVSLQRTLDPTAFGGGLGEQPDHVWMVVRADQAYLGQVAHRLEPYEVRTAVSRIGRTSLTFVARFVDPLDGDRELAASTHVLVQGDASGRPRPLSAEVREGAARYAALEG